MTTTTTITPPTTPRITKTATTVRATGVKNKKDISKKAAAQTKAPRTTAKKTHTQKVLSEGKSFDPLKVFPSSHLKGYDCNGRKIKEFDFIAHRSNAKHPYKVDFVEQADSNCHDWSYGGYVINSPLSQAWSQLEKSLLSTIRNLGKKTTIEHKNITIVIDPKGGEKLDCPPNDRSKYYPTFEFKNNKTNDSVFYEYFQLSAQDRALLALDLIEDLR